MAPPHKRLPLDRLLRPGSVAIVGASPTPGSLGASVLANLEHSGYGGKLYLINPKRTEILGRQCLPSVDSLPKGVDCAVLAIPRQGVLEAVRACARRSTGSVIIFASGFAESGIEGLAEQQEIARIARENNMVVQGPNCLGTVNCVDSVALTFIATPAVRLAAGHQGIAIVSQSGAMAAVLIVNLAARKLGISFSISTGNEAGSCVEDYVEYMIADPNTRVVTMIVEQFRSPRRFLELLQQAADRGKYIVLLHPGSSSAGRASGATHTGAMAGDYQTMRTRVKRAGAVWVDTLEQLADVSELLTRFPSMPRGGAAVVTESGAFKAMALDFCERIGLDLPPFAPGANDALRAVMPDFIAPANPMDLTAQGLVDPDLYRRTLPLILGEIRCGSLLLAIILTDEKTSDLKFPPILSALRAVQKEPSLASKPIVFAGMDEGAQPPDAYIEELREMGVSFFPSPERAMQALSIVTAWTDAQTGKKVRDTLLVPNIPDTKPNLPPGVIPEYRSKEVLKSTGIPVPAGRMARTLEEAIGIANDIGFPVVMKAQSSGLSHKSDAGGVVLDLKDTRAVTDSWAQLHHAIAVSMPGLVLDGVLVEQMSPSGVELIVGARNDRDWGPVMLVGFGGVLAEALNDVRLLSPDLSIDEIIGELHQLRGSALLRGFRGTPKSDVRAAAEIVARLARLMLSTESIREVDLNPVIVFPEGRGAVALDALIVTDQMPEHYGCE